MTSKHFRYSTESGIPSLGKSLPTFIAGENSNVVIGCIILLADGVAYATARVDTFSKMTVVDVLFTGFLVFVEACVV